MFVDPMQEQLSDQPLPVIVTAENLLSCLLSEYEYWKNADVEASIGATGAIANVVGFATVENFRADWHPQKQLGRDAEQKPIDLLIYCPNCGQQHIDAPQPEKGWDNPPHKSHACQFCKDAAGNPFVWRIGDVYTNGVAEIQTKGQRDQSPTPALQRLVA